MNGLNEMNTYKRQWMEHAQLLHEITVVTSTNGQVEYSTTKLETASRRTARAVASGIALSAIDGPLPVMDVVGFGVTTTLAALAWYDYFSTS